MENILTENVLDSRLESCDGTNLFDCLTSDSMNDENDHVEQNPPAAENNQIPITTDDTDAILNFIQTTSGITPPDELTEKVNESSRDSQNTETCSVEADIDKGNEFIPTIVDIRGACDNALEQPVHDANPIPNEVPIIGDVQDANSEQDKTEAVNVIAQEDSTVVHTIDDSDDTNIDTSAKPVSVRFLYKFRI